MRSSVRKPSKWMWLAGGALVSAGILVGLPAVPAILRERLSGGLFLGGILVLVFCFFRREQYRELPPEERRDADCEAQDERYQMIRGRAAWYCGRVEDVVLVAASVLWLAYVDPTLLHNIPYWFLLGRRMVLEGIQWYLERKY